jgi:hypothetical protein
MASCYIGCKPLQNQQQQQLLLPNQVVPPNDLVDAITALSELRHALMKSGAPQPQQQRVDKQGNASRQKQEFFPSVLHQILADESLSDIITWLPNGESFCVLKPDKFVSVIEKYFGGESSVKYASFTRKLNRW